VYLFDAFNLNFHTLLSLNIDNDLEAPLHHLTIALLSLSPLHKNEKFLLHFNKFFHKPQQPPEKGQWLL
jgi:hypothetical protein